MSAATTALRSGDWLAQGEEPDDALFYIGFHIVDLTIAIDGFMGGSSQSLVIRARQGVGNHGFGDAAHAQEIGGQLFQLLGESGRRCDRTWV